MATSNRIGRDEEPINWQRPQSELLTEADRRYQTIVKPLEQPHRGNDVVVTSTGQMVVRPTEPEAVDEAVAVLGPGHLVFHIGNMILGSIR